MKNKITHILPETRKGYDFLYVVVYPGHDIPFHDHAGADELVYVLKGNLTVSIGRNFDRNSEEEYSEVLGPGESVFIKRNVCHAFSCEKKVECICVVKPPIFISPDKLLLFFAKLFKPLKCRSAKKLTED